MKNSEVSQEVAEARRRRGKHARNKGAKGELEAAEFFREWWDEVEPGCEFKRIPMSGGWASAKLRKDLNASGDLATNAKLFPFCAEIKRREDFDVTKLLMAAAEERHQASPIWPCWAQARKSAEEAAKTPIMVFRISRASWWCLVPATRYMHARVGRPGFLVRGPKPEDRAYLVEFSKLLAIAPRVFLAPVAKTG